MKVDWVHLFDAIAVFLAAVAAFFSRRNNRQLKPSQQKVGRAAHSRQNNFEGHDISIGDLVTGLLEEVNRVHDRLDDMELKAQGTKSR